MVQNGKRNGSAMRRTPVIALAIFGLIIANPVYAFGIFIKYQDIDGGVTSGDHAGWSAINSLFLPISASGGQGKATFGPVETQQDLDKSYPTMLTTIGSGLQIPKVMVDFVDLIDVKGTLHEFTFFQMEFGSAYLTQLDYAAGTDGPPEVDTKFNFKTIKVTYIEQDPKGGAGKATSAAWDLGNASAASAGDVASLFAAGLAGTNAVVVPLPGSAWLFMLALGATARLRRRSRES